MNLVREILGVIATTAAIVLTAWTVGAVLGLVKLGFCMVSGCGV